LLGPCTLIVGINLLVNKEAFMIITFKSKAGSDTAYFKNIALKLLAMMGRDNKVPSALYAEDVPVALQALKQELAKLELQEKEQLQEKDNDHDIEYDAIKREQVSIQTRAQPLIELLTKAAKKQASVFWE
jgi:GTPase SAR1 family protein